jgi:hypothetical protein
MKEARELQTLVEQLERYIERQAQEIVRLRRALTEEVGLSRATQIFGNEE